MMLMMMIGGVVWCVGGAVAVLAGGLSVKREREREREYSTGGASLTAAGGRN
jgi:hypothetical protein